MFHLQQKMLLRPLLEKHTLDPEVFAKYRPISNLPSKVREKAVATQLQEHVQEQQQKKHSI